MAFEDGPYTNIDISIPVRWRNALMDAPGLSGSSPTHRITSLIWRAIGEKLMEEDRAARERADYEEACEFVFEYASRKKRESEARK